MDNIYDFGVDFIVLLQKHAQPLSEVFRVANVAADPHSFYHYLLPLVSAFDSVFAAQFILVCAANEWANAVLKWLLSEHRPYWYVLEYSRPVSLLMTPQTCETGPGSPSGHLMLAAAQLYVLGVWIDSLRINRSLRVAYWCVSACLLVVVAAARMYIAAHFPHQCLLGAISGLAISPLLCKYLVTNYLQQGVESRTKQYALTAVALALLTMAVHHGMAWCGIDPQWSVQLAYKWCPSPEYVHVSTTPVYSLVDSLGAMLGWSLAATPVLARYRHNTPHTKATIVTAIAAAYTFQISTHHIVRSLPASNSVYYYALLLALSALQPVLLLRGVPTVYDAWNRWNEKKME